MESIYRKIDELISSGKRAVFCVVTETCGSTPRKAGSKMVVVEDGSVIGTIGGGAIELNAVQTAMELLDDPKPFKKSYKLEEDLSMSCGGNVEVFFDPIFNQEKLYVFGGGHVGKALANFSLALGFQVYIIDDRPDIAESYTKREGINFIIDKYDDAIDNLKFDNNTYVVIVTPEHKYDELVLRKTVIKETAYLGMIGSNRKVEKIRNSILQDNVVSEEALNSVNMPIGIKLNCETPEEIAISIIAKIVDVRNSK